MGDVATAPIEGEVVSRPGPIQAFTFGEPEPVLNRRELLDNIECWRNGRWYEPPVSTAGLARTFQASPHHSSAIRVKVNLLTESFVPHPLLSRTEFGAMALDYLVMGNGYLEERRNISGRPLRLVRSLARHTRRGVEPGEYYFLTQGAVGGLNGEHRFEPGTVHHVLEPDLSQEVYGVPEYLSALQSAFLNEAATLFRRRYYLNGAHAGFILYMTDSAQKQEDIDNLREALKGAKGPGNFKNLFVHAPNGKKDGIQIMPISEVAAKDDFLNIKNVSRDDVLAAHRVPPQLLGVVPANAGGFGDVGKATDAFFELEIKPLQARLATLNDSIGVEVVRFSPRAPLSVAASAAAA